DGMVAKLSDIYTDFQERDQASAFINNLSGELQGIGIIIEKIDGKITIIAPLQDSPAEKAGLKANDIVTKVDGKDVEEFNFEEVVAMIKGESGTAVKLEVSRDGQKLTFNITREFILLKT